MKKLVNIIQIAGFYLFNAIVLSFLMDIYSRKSIQDLLVFGGVILAIIAAMSGICYSAVACASSDVSKRVFAVSGHRFLHCFLSLVFGLFFVGADIQIKAMEFPGFLHSLISWVVEPIIGLFALYSLFWAARSFIMGYHMLRELLNRAFPLKDERLFDDLAKAGQL